jgi:hypothetical protein
MNVEPIENPKVEQLKRCAAGNHTPLYETSQGFLCLSCRAVWPKMRSANAGPPQAAPRAKSRPSISFSPAVAVLDRDGRIA